MISEKHHCFYAAPLYSLWNTRKNHFTYFLFTNLDFLKVHWWKDVKTEIHDGTTYKRRLNFFGLLRCFHTIVKHNKTVEFCLTPNEVNQAV